MPSGDNNNGKNSDQFNSLYSRANLEKERRKESEYKAMFLELLQRHRNILRQTVGPGDTSSSSGTSVQEYSKERDIIKKLMAMERDAIMGSVAIGLSAFATIRYFPRIGIRLIGGDAKVQAMKAAEVRSYRSSPKASLAKSMLTLALEGSFGFWAAYKGFDLILNRQSKDGHIQNEIGNLPMIEGRSVICNSICDDWTKLIRYKVPNNFWRAVDEDGSYEDGAQRAQSQVDSQNRIRDEDFWKAVRQFGNSCVKRRRYEELIRRKEGNERDRNSHFPTIPPPGVPEEIMELTDEEVLAMLDVQ